MSGKRWSFTTEYKVEAAHIPDILGAKTLRLARATRNRR